MPCPDVTVRAGGCNGLPLLIGQLLTAFDVLFCSFLARKR
jgi:hypothetical protein